MGPSCSRLYPKRTKKALPLPLEETGLGFAALAGVEFDDLLLLKELREVLSLGKSDDLAGHVLNVGLHVSRDRRAFVMVGSGNLLAGVAIANTDDIADSELEARDVDKSAVDRDVTVADHLSSLEDASGIAKSPNGGAQAELKESKEVEAGIAAHSLRLLEGVAELLFEEVVIASNDLLCKQLFAVLRLSSLLQVRTVLSGRIRSLRDRLVRSSPNVKSDGSADVVLSSSIRGHKSTDLVTHG